MEQAKIQRINELAHKKKTIGLTELEQKEQKKLRKEYLSLIRKNFRNTMSNIRIEYEDGSVKPLKSKKKS